MNAAVSAPAQDIEFDIPAQPLQSAIERYSVITGISVLYLGTLVIGRTSAPVKGRYTPDAALGILIGKAGLTISHTTAEAFVLMQAESDSGWVQADEIAPAPAASDTAYRTYYGSVQTGLRDTLCRDARIAPDNFRAALQFWVDPTGQITLVRLLDTTGDKARDSAIVDALRRTRVAQPPAELEQPFTMLVLPRAAARTADCHVG